MDTPDVQPQAQEQPAGPKVVAQVQIMILDNGQVAAGPNGVLANKELCLTMLAGFAQIVRDYKEQSLITQGLNGALPPLRMPFRPPLNGRNHR